MQTDVDVLVVGAGAVGLACAQALAAQGLDVLVVERHGHAGEETSSRNSEVIHAGIYYPTGSLKARLCVRGKQLLYAFCRANQVAYNNCGKLILATAGTQLAQLRAYQAQARANGAGELRWLDAAEVLQLEPHVQAQAGLFSPSTGILDSHGYLLALQARLQGAGGMIAFANEVIRAQPLPAGVGHQVECRDLGTGGMTQLTCRWLLNAAGLSAPDLARQLTPDHAALLPTAYYAKGHYYSYSIANPPFRHLVYPIAEAAGLGVHVTLDLQGQVRFGPDVQWIKAPDYRFDTNNRSAFETAIRAYFPTLDSARLQPGYTGIRPKISGPNAPAADFAVQTPITHGVPGLLHLFGIESPGLTASLALAELVALLIAQPGLTVAAALSALESD